MATVTRTIIAGGGGDYTTIAAWEAATNLNGGADIWQGVISDNSAYDESVTFGSTGGSSTSYQHLTVASGNRHAGVWSTSRARIDYSGSNTAVFELTDPYGFLEWLQIYRGGANMGSSDEGVRVSDNNCLISRCIIWTDDLTEINNDGIHMSTAFRDSAVGPDCYIDHCVIYGWHRCGIFVNFPEADIDIYVDHCSISYNRDSGESVIGANVMAGDIGDTSFGAYHLYNNNVAGHIADLTGNDRAEVMYDSGLTVSTLNGSHNVRTTGFATPYDIDTDNSTNWQDAADGTTDSAPASSGAYVTDYTGVTTFDFTPVDHANNVLLANGTDRQGSEPEARQDFSTDITGASRPTNNVDIGPFQISSGGALPERAGVRVGHRAVTGQLTNDAFPERAGVRLGHDLVDVPRAVPAAFPIVELAAGIELAFGAGANPLEWVWTDVTELLADRLLRQTLTSKRGRSDESSETTAGSLQATFDNSDGALTPRNASSPYWPNVRRGVPMRQWVEAGTPALLLGGAGWAQTPDHVDFAVTDLDVRFKVDPAAWSHTVDWALGNGSRSFADKVFRFASKWDFANGNGISWHLSQFSAGWPLLETWDGAASNFYWSPRILAFRRSVWLAMTHDVDDGAGNNVLRLYSTHLDPPPADVTTWDLFDELVDPGTTSIATSAASVAVGSRNQEGSYIGRIEKFEHRDGINGTIIADPDFTAADPGDMFLKDSTGKIWTLVGDAQISRRRYRYVGNVDDWAGPEWPLGDNEPDNALRPSESRVTATSSGVLRRLGTGARSKPLRSTLYRHIVSDRRRPYVLAYWPMEDPRGAAALGSGLSGGLPAPITGARLADRDDLLASAPLPTVQAGDVASWAAAIPAGAVGADRWVVDFLWRIDTADADPTYTRLITFRSDGTDGGPSLWHWEINDTNIRILAYDSTGAQVESNTVGVPAGSFGAWMLSRFDVQQDGADIDWTWTLINIDVGTGATHSDTIVGSTLGTLLEIGNDVTGPPDGYSFGHVILTDGSVLTSSWLAGADTAWVGETAAHRIWRLCNEERIPIEIVGDPDATSASSILRGDPANSQPMGPQEQRTLLHLIRSAVRLDMGVLIERRGIPGLQYRTRKTIEAQDPILELDASRHARGDIINPLEPRLDDQRLLNDATIRSRFGSAAQIVDQDHIDDEGLYDTELTLEALAGVDVQDAILSSTYGLRLAVDTQNLHQAGWRVHLGTWPELRWPSVTIPIEVIALLYPAIIDEWLAVELGDRVTLTNLPVQYPDEAVELIVDHVRESMSSNRWRPQLACSPGGPWLVTKLQGASVDLTLPRLADDGAVTLTSDITDSATSIALSGTDLTEVAGNYPLDIIVGGERITAAGNTAQTLTGCTRSVNGVVKAHSAGAAVAIAYPTILAMGTT